MLCGLLSAAVEPSKSVKAEKVDKREVAETALYVKTVPEGADVTVKKADAEGAQEAPLRKTSPSLFEIPAGVKRVTVTIELPGYQAERRTIRVEGGRITRMVFDLETDGRKARSEDTPESPGAVLKALLSALARGDVGAVAQLGLTANRDDIQEFHKHFDLNGIGIHSTFTTEKYVCAVTTPFPDSSGEGRHALGIGFEKKGGSWQVKDIDFLPDQAKVDSFIREFRDRFPRAVEGVPRVSTQRKDLEQAARRYGRALAEGDIKTLKEFWDLRDPLDQFAGDLLLRALKQEKLPPEEQVQFVACAPCGKDRFFSGYRVASMPPLGEQAGPLFQTFASRNGHWSTKPLPNLRFIASARTLTAEVIGRRSLVQALINLRFGETNWEDCIAAMHVQAETFRFLNETDGEQKHFGAAADSVEASIREYEAWRGRPWNETVQAMIEQYGAGQQGEPQVKDLLNDFFLLFFLEADDRPAGHRLTLPENGEAVFVERFPCFTGELVKSAVCVLPPHSPRTKKAAPLGGERCSVRVILNEAGAKIFGRITKENVGRRLVMLVDGKVVAAPVIKSPITGGEALITGRFTEDEAKKIADTLNAYRKQCQDYLKGMMKELESEKE